MKYVFLHGGPGANSLAEQAILGPILQSSGYQTTFWNEPSSLRLDGDPFEADGAFERWLASAEQSVLRSALTERAHVIAHSFAVQAAWEIARRHASRLSTLILVAPAADPFATFRNVLRLAREDLLEAKPDVATAIADSLERSRVLMDDAMQAGMLNVLQDERLFTHYWAEPGQMQASMAACEGPDGQFDVNSFFAVLSDFARRGATLLSRDPISVPTLVLFGAVDPVTPPDEQCAAVQAAAPNARIEVVDGCSHHVHLDRPMFFVDRIVRWARDRK
jgi:pimeloyl-ACP methyl ester carboxylesterase